MVSTIVSGAMTGVGSIERSILMGTHVIRQQIFLLDPAFFLCRQSSEHLRKMPPQRRVQLRHLGMKTT